MKMENYVNTKAVLMEMNKLNPVVGLANCKVNINKSLVRNLCATLSPLNS